MAGHHDSAHETYPDAAPHPEPETTDEISHRDARMRFGGMNWGSAFFGWLVSVASAILLTSALGAVAAAVGTTTDAGAGAAERQSGTVALVAAGALLAIMLVAYYTGGYVAGRMSRFDGTRQGLAVWTIGLFVTLVGVGLGLVLGPGSNPFDGVGPSAVAVPTEQLGWLGVVTAAVFLLGTLLAAMAGGKVGQRYHTKVDRAAYR